jgi:Fe2+ or Zn2+ uptake regulation protein
MAGYHPTAAEVFTRLKGDHPQMSLATVYRALHALVEQGQIGEARIDNVTRYDASPEPHHHVVCRGCGAVGDVFAPLPPAALRRLREASPFALDVRSLHLSGVCPVCAAAAA